MLMLQDPRRRRHGVVTGNGGVAEDDDILDALFDEIHVAEQLGTEFEICKVSNAPWFFCVPVVTFSLTLVGDCLVPVTIFLLISERTVCSDGYRN